jgi:amidohydrolase
MAAEVTKRVTMLERATHIETQLIDWRRTFHMHPELGFRETGTAALVSQVLHTLGYRVRTGVGRTGVVGEHGDGPPIIAVRADMDALPLQEANEVAYASRVPGVMHACGHDAHTAMALGVATLLAQEEFPGTIRLLFQPAEEVSDDEGLSGAPRMVKDGAMEGVAAVLALHVNANIPVGEIAIESGPASAGVDSFSATITGSGAHGAYPHRGVDPIHLAGHVILALHGIVSRRVNPFEPAVITVGSVHAGHANNVIPEAVEMSGTIRYENQEVQRLLHTEIERALEIARTLGGDYTLDMRFGSAPVINDPRLAELLRQVGADLLGAGRVKRPEKGMGAEDFSVFADLAPGAMFRLGCRIDGDERKAHGPRFDIDERCLPIGCAILAEAALRLLCGGLEAVSTA